ncbi:hypothetical protein AVEN_255090-1 [Araneus ventricosus]|uniref:Uncharacterized protein n=1 Tax=Araneus ventricosus TaxID=182803 RepID=A0A4Y2EH91_ARAVE|nr:hypothetical protein AVEN_255090-1 [Araneus ventricosus]
MASGVARNFHLPVRSLRQLPIDSFAGIFCRRSENPIVGPYRLLLEGRGTMGDFALADDKTFRRQLRTPRNLRPEKKKTLICEAPSNVFVRYRTLLQLLQNMLLLEPSGLFEVVRSVEGPGQFARVPQKKERKK